MGRRAVVGVHCTMIHPAYSSDRQALESRTVLQMARVAKMANEQSRERWLPWVAQEESETTGRSRAGKASSAPAVACSPGLLCRQRWTSWNRGSLLWGWGLLRRPEENVRKGPCPRD